MFCWPLAGDLHSLSLTSIVTLPPSLQLALAPLGSDLERSREPPPKKTCDRGERRISEKNRKQYYYVRVLSEKELRSSRPVCCAVVAVESGAFRESAPLFLPTHLLPFRPSVRPSPHLNFWQLRQGSEKSFSPAQTANKHTADALCTKSSYTIGLARRVSHCCETRGAQIQCSRRCCSKSWIMVLSNFPSIVPFPPFPRSRRKLVIVIRRD